MKRNCALLFFIFTFLTLSVFSQQLTFKMDNPRIIRSNNKQLLRFDVLVKASDTGTYLYGSQISMSCNAFYFITSPSNNIEVTKGFISGTYNGNQKYDINGVNYNGNKFAIGLSSSLSNSGSNPRLACAPVLTEFQVLITIGLEIANPNGIAGLAFYDGFMHAGPGGLQTYALNPLPSHGYYTGPNLFEGENFQNLYLSRVFSPSYGWTQYGGPTNDVPYLDWTTPVNTSVWDSLATITGSALVSKLRVHSAGQLVISPGAQMNCYDSVEIGNAQGLWVKSNASYTGSFIDNGIITYKNSGSAAVERYLTQDVLHGYCLPVTTTNTHPFIDLQLLSKWYDEPAHQFRSIVNPAGDSILNHMMLGYLVYSNSSLTGNSTIKATGPLNTGPAGYLMTNHIGPDGPDGWHMVGNPYPSAINWVSDGFALSDVDPTIYVFHPETGNFYFWNRHDQLFTTGASPILSSQQGFWMHATVPGSLSGNISLDNSIRLHSNQPFYRPDTLSNEHLILTVRGNNFIDETRVRFDASTSVLFDSEHDAYKLFGSDDAPQLYTVLEDTTKVALNARPWGGFNTLIPLGFHIPVASSDTIVASNLDSFQPGIVIWLEDKKTGSWLNLMQWPQYVFSALPEDSPDRFMLHFSNPYTGVDSKTKGSVRIYSYDASVYVVNRQSGLSGGDVFIYDRLGRLVFKDRLGNPGMNKYNPVLTGGYYVVKVVSSEQSTTQKVFLN
jgi:hypothetical protein